jgi:N-acetyl-1-D-myo-inositol-2-amino-2-deoxy-alpha-D-glucopyranoside deacetylase
VLVPESWAREDREWLAAHPPTGTGWLLPDPDGDYPPSVLPDDQVTHEVVGPELVPVQADALRAHATQVTVAPSGDVYALSNDIAARIPGREGFSRLDPATGLLATQVPAGGVRHTDLLQGAR